MSLAQKAGQAGVLMLFRKVWGALVSFAVMAYLARVLDKSDFGIVAISSTLIALVQSVAVSGIAEYLIFYKGADERKVTNAAFWLNLLLTLGVLLLCALLAPFWSDFYSDDRVTNIVSLLLIGFLFTMVSAIPVALFRKRLEYKKLILIQTVFATITNGGQVILAYLGFGVYSLVIPSVMLAPVMTAVLFWKSSFYPDMTLGIHYWRKIYGYTKFVIGQRILGKFVNEGDTIIVGKFFSMDVLGVYNLAFQFSNLFTNHFVPIITNISLPVFARNNDNVELVKQHYYKMIRIISFVTMPVIALMILNADFLITNIYGEKWRDAVLPFQILSVYVMARSIGSPTSGLYSAMGKPQVGMYFILFFAPLFIAAIYGSAQTKNLIIFVTTVTFMRFLGTIYHFYLASSLLKEKVVKVFRVIAPIVVSVFISFLIVSLMPDNYFLHELVNSGVLLLIIFLSFRLFWKNELSVVVNDVLHVIPDRLGKKVGIIRRWI